MTVISVRPELIAWYQRRGWELTGAREPFPYDALREGSARRMDLEFVVLTRALA